MSRRCGRNCSGLSCTASSFVDLRRTGHSRQATDGLPSGFTDFPCTPSLNARLKCRVWDLFRRPRVKTSAALRSIELLIVISIILVILAIAVPKMNTQMQGAREMAVIRKSAASTKPRRSTTPSSGSTPRIVSARSSHQWADGVEGANIIPKVLADGKKNGYTYALAAAQRRIAVTAVPDSFGNSGRPDVLLRSDPGDPQQLEPGTRHTASPEIK
jgi:Tfp pilus assembly protein FimT